MTGQGPPPTLPSSPLPTVFVVDDDPSVRKSIARLLRAAGYAVETCASAQELLDGDRLAGHGCLVLDVQLPGMNGLELQEKLEGAGCDLPIVFITGHGDIPSSVKAMKAGAVDFLPKPFQDEDLLRAIRQAIARDGRQRIERAEREAIAARHATLTPREREVMALVVTGRLNKQIAAELGTAEKTIKVHRHRVMEKMGVASVADLVRAAERLGMTAPDRFQGQRPSPPAREGTG
jgi:FixJ family two-component response regulator